MSTKKLIGPAGQLQNLFARTLEDSSTVKLLFAGPPGVGKSELAQQIAMALCGDKWGVERVNGRNVSIHLVREWVRDVASSSLFGTGWKIKIVDEVDTMPADSQDALLSFLDTLPPGRGFIATSNLDLDKLTPRFVTRLQRHTVDGPEAEEIAAFLCEVHGVPALVAQQIAFLCGGCVRAAELDAAAWRNEHGSTKASTLAGRVRSLQFAQEILKEKELA